MQYKITQEIKKVKLLKPVSVFLLFALISSCIDPFNPELGKFHSLLVIDALVTDENASYYCILTRTFEKLSDRPGKVTGATVSVRDDLGDSYAFTEVAPGKYKSDSLSFRASPGRSYILKVATRDGEVYESDPAAMLQVPDIDSLYYGVEAETDDKGNVWNGVMIYLDTKKTSDGKYLRWTYDETWKFNIPSAVTYEFIDHSNIRRIPMQNVTCWKHHKSDTIIVETSESDVNTEFRKKPLLFIASRKSDRLTVRYYINVKQYSMSKDEYMFWNQMKQIGEAGGDIFDRQAFQLVSNIHNVNKPGDQVLGYFQVSAVSDASLYIDYRELYPLNLPGYQYICARFEAGPGDPLPFPGPPLILTFETIYDIFTQNGYVFIGPVLSESGETLYKLVFTEPACADCTKTGNPEKPDFWVDWQWLK